MKSKWPVVLFLMCAGALVSNAQGTTVEVSKTHGTLPLFFDLSPGAFLPIGEAADYFGPGTVTTFGAGYTLPWRFLALTAEIGYGWDPMSVAEQSVSLVSIAGGAQVRIPLGPRFLLKLDTLGGYHYGVMHGVGKFLGDDGLYVAGGLGATFFITSSLGLGLSARYVNYLPVDQGVAALVVLTYDPAGAVERAKMYGKRPSVRQPDLLQAQTMRGPNEGLKVTGIRWENIFPVLYKYYDEHPIGTAMLRNLERDPLTDIKLTLMVKGYMDSPKQCPAPTELRGGEEVQVSLPALFNKSVLEITETEGTKVAVELLVQYRQRGEWVREIQTEQVRIYNRNNMVWDDDRKVAAFVTRTDPAVQLFAKNVLNATRDSSTMSVNQNLTTALAIHEALRLYGINYVVDPTSSYAELSKSSAVVDYLQFPRQTLEVQGGDCDDLAILYCALLESVNVPTAFVTVPGHIFMAVSLDTSPSESRETFSRTDDLIFDRDKVWLPLEITERTGGFVKAWQEGSRQWRKYSSNQEARLYPFSEAAKLYESASYIDTAERVAKQIILPDGDEIVQVFLKELTHFTEGEIYPRVSKLEKQIKDSGENPGLVNKLGVLYAKYGLYDRAQSEFFRALQKNPEFYPALANLGNIYYLQDNLDQALNYYKRAYLKAPDNPTVLLGIAQVNHRKERYTEATEAFAQLKRIDPGLADQYAFLNMGGAGAARAADVAKTKGAVRWSDEN